MGAQQSSSSSTIDASDPGQKCSNNRRCSALDEKSIDPDEVSSNSMKACSKPGGKADDDICHTNTVPVSETQQKESRNSNPLNNDDVTQEVASSQKSANQDKNNDNDANQLDLNEHQPPDENDQWDDVAKVKFNAKIDVVHPRRLKDPAWSARKAQHSLAGTAPTPLQESLDSRQHDSNSKVPLQVTKQCGQKINLNASGNSSSDEVHQKGGPVVTDSNEEKKAAVGDSRPKFKFINSTKERTGQKPKGRVRPRPPTPGMPKRHLNVDDDDQASETVQRIQPNQAEDSSRCHCNADVQAAAQSPYSENLNKFARINDVKETDKVIEYKRLLHEKDVLMSNNKNIRTTWLLGRFLFNRQIAKTIIEKYHERGFGVNLAQKMISFFLMEAHNTLPPSAMKVLMSEEHRHFKASWMPYLQLAPKKKLTSYIKSSKLYNHLLKKLVEYKACTVRGQLEAASAPIEPGSSETVGSVEKNFVVRTCPSTTTGFEVVDFAKKWEMVDREKDNVKIQLYLLVGELSSTEEQVFTFHLKEAIPRQENMSEKIEIKNLPSIWTASTTNNGHGHTLYNIKRLFHTESQTAPTDIADDLRKKPFGGEWKDLISWPWTSDCEDLVRRVLILTLYNTSVKSIRSNKSNAEEYETHKRSKSKRGKKGKSNTGDATSEKSEEVPISNETAGCQHFECHIQYEETANDVLAICHGIVIFPLAERITSTMVFFDDPFAFFPISKDEWHHHDAVVVDLLVPTSPSTRFDLENDINLIVDILSRYIFSLRLHAFQNRDMNIKKSAYEDHFREFQQMCENVINFIIFSEVCGPAELKLRGANYLTNARMHQQNAKTSAIEIGVFPLFIKFLNTEVVTLPDRLKVVKTPSAYYSVLEFCDYRLGDAANGKPQSIPKDTQVDYIVEPACVAILESVIGKGYLGNLDDELAFKVITGQYEINGSGDGVALVTPIYERKSSNEFRLYDAIKPVFTADGYTNDRRQEVEKIVEEICNNAYKMYIKNFSGGVTGSGSRLLQRNSKRREPAWKQLHHFVQEMQDEFTERRRIAIERSAAALEKSENASGSEESSSATQSNSADDVSDRDDVDSKGETTQSDSKDSPESKSEVQSAEKVKSNEGSDAAKPQEKRKKANKDYLSPSKRQQRQVQRLREKWEKKKKAEADTNTEKEGDESTQQNN